MAHELGHLVLGPVHRDGERANIMFNGREDAGSLLQKRLNTGQVGDARRSRFVKQR